MVHRHTTTACSGGSGACTSYGAGHNTHTVRATLAGADPRGWRAAVVDEIHGYGISLAYVDEPGRVELWHHRRLDGALEIGARVRLHHSQALLEVGTNWLAVVIAEVDDD